MLTRLISQERFDEADQAGREQTELTPLPWQKRLLDVCLSLGLLVALSPLMLVIMAAIKLDGLLQPNHRGPFFLSEPRGSEGRVFRIPKFRIIRMDVYHRVSSEQKYLHIKPMERVPENLTATGHYLKKFYLDELPQLFSILRGDMSFVGPRPWPLEPYYEEIEDGVLRKKLIRPGLTGLVQASKGDPTSPTEWSLDYSYIGFMASNRGGWAKLWFDMKILFWSLRTVLQAKGL
jgi:lipopolysaccharide/colanic/teichoic acid biosynthesis glycosyltransferase